MRGFALEVWLLLPPSNSSVERNPSQINSKTSLPRSRFLDVTQRSPFGCEGDYSKTGHFRFVPSLCFKARLCVTLLINLVPRFSPSLGTRLHYCLMNMIFYCHANKTHFYKKGFALGLVLKVRVSGTRKWPITI